MEKFNTAELEYILRLVIAAVCGALIGFERKNRSKEAGVRTHCVVSCASALMIVLPKYAYSDVMSQYGELMKIDPSRIASGAVSGICFLGAGMIFVHKKTITGLTTAAGVWATAGVGMAIGSGMFLTGGAAAIIILLIQIILHLTPNRHVRDITDKDALCTQTYNGELIDISFSEETDEEGNVVFKIRCKTPTTGKQATSAVCQ